MRARRAGSATAATSSGGSFDARDLAVMAHAAGAQAGVVHRLFGAVDLAQELQRDRRAVREARRQARQRGFVPHLQAEPVRELAHVGFAQPRFVQRAAHAVFARGLAPGPPVAFVVAVVAVDDVRDAALARDLGKAAVQLALAEIAAVRPGWPRRRDRAARASRSLRGARRSPPRTRPRPRTRVRRATRCAP